MWSRQGANRDKVFVEKPIFQLIQKLEGLAPLSPSPQFLAYAEEESLRKGAKNKLMDGEQAPLERSAFSLFNPPKKAESTSFK